MIERNVLLVRHLRTEYNNTGMIMGGKIDIGIKKDEKSINEFVEKFKNARDRYQIKQEEVVIISSPLLRCQETSLIMRDIIGSEVEILTDGRLQETDMGDFADKKANDLRTEYGKSIDIWMHEPESFSFPGGESYQDVKKRVNSIKEDVLKLYKQKTIILCSHVDIIKMFICEVEGKSFNTRRFFSIPNGSISILSFSKDNQLKIDGVNVYP